MALLLLLPLFDTVLFNTLIKGFMFFCCTELAATTMSRVPRRRRPTTCTLRHRKPFRPLYKRDRPCRKELGHCRLQLHPYHRNCTLGLALGTKSKIVTTSTPKSKIVTIPDPKSKIVTTSGLKLKQSKTTDLYFKLTPLEQQKNACGVRTGQQYKK